MCRPFIPVLGIVLFTAVASAAEPNLLVDVSRQVASAAVAQTLNQSQCINERRQSVQVRGVAQVAGAASLRFVPSDERAELYLVVEGTIDTRTVAARGPVQVHNAGHIPYRALKPVAVDGERLYWGPARGCADAALDLLGITTRLHGPLDPLLRRVATNAYRRQEGEAIRTIAREASQQVASEFDKSSEPELAKADQSYRERLIGRLRQHGILPQELRLSTTTEQLFVRARLTGAAPTDWGTAPAVTSPSDLTVRVHQSLLNTSAATLFAGKTLTDEQFAREFKGLFGSAAVKPPPEPQERFSVTFADGLPIVTTFADGQVTAVVRTRGFTSGDTVYEDPYDVSIRYDLTPTPEKLALVRQELRARDPAGRPLAGRTFTISRLLTRNLEKALPERISLDPLALPEELKKAGPLRATQGSSDNGWLTLAWRRAAP